MGLFSPRYGCDCKYSTTAGRYNINSPNPWKFTIHEIWQYKHATVAIIDYPNCTNFEGSKVIVFRGQQRDALLKAEQIDPHFYQKSTTLSIIARFRPDAKHVDLARQFAKSYTP